MTKSSFSIYKDVGFVLSGHGNKKDYFENEYRYFKDPNTESVLTVEFGKDFIEPKLVLGDKRQHFARNGPHFMVTDANRQIAITDNWQKLYCAELIPDNLTRTLIEGEVRHKAASDSAAMVHASGVCYKDTVFVFPAWRHTGKTNTMMLLLQRGANMLSDDRLWIEADGTVHPYHVPVHILPYNFRSFPELKAHQSRANKVRGDLHQRIKEVVARRSSIVSGGISQINRHVIRPTNTHVHLSDLFQNKQVSESKELSNVVFLQTNSEEDSTITYDRISDESAVCKLSAINYYEWDRELEEVYSAYDHLFSNTAPKREDLKELKEAQTEVFEQVAKNHNCYELQVPREDRWSKSTKQQIVSEIESML